MIHASDRWESAILIALLSAIVLLTIVTAQRGRKYFVRRIPGLNAIDEAVGRATEMGRPILMVPGLSGLGVVGLQALTIFSYIIKTAAQFGNRLIMPTADSALYTVAEEVVRDSYTAAGKPEDYDPNSVYFLSDRQFAFASGVAGTIFREKVAASFLFGDFFAESLIFAEAGQQVGAIQVAGTVSTTQLPFFIASCDYTIIGDEYYAASAYISREPTLLGSLVGQDYCKIIILLVVLIGTIAMSIPALGAKWFFIQWFTL
ncbi:MAG: hypothetical protein HUU17_07555 [Chthonomonadales bacterium]|nr:hypothetical protein [Chthonomonadales bacterium]